MLSAVVTPHTFWNILLSPAQSWVAQTGSSVEAAYLALAAVPSSTETRGGGESLERQLGTRGRRLLGETPAEALRLG